MKGSKKSLNEITIEPVELLNSSSTSGLRFYKGRVLTASNVLAYMYVHSTKCDLTGSCYENDVMACFSFAHFY